MNALYVITITIFSTAFVSILNMTFTNFYLWKILFVNLNRTKFKLWAYVRWLCSWLHLTWPLSLRRVRIPESYLEYNKELLRRKKHMRPTSFSQTNSEGILRRISAWWFVREPSIQLLFFHQSSFATHATSLEHHVPYTVTFVTAASEDSTITVSG